MDGFQEVKVGGKTSGVITPRNDLKKTFRVSRTIILYILNKIQADRATVEQVRMLRLKTSTQKLRTSGVLDWLNNGSSHRLKPT